MRKTILILAFILLIGVCTVVHADHIRVSRVSNHNTITEVFLDGHVETNPVIDWWSGEPIKD